jgi:hypothetical protein
MGHHHDHAVDVDPKQVEEAKEGWIGFTSLMKWSILGIIALMAVLALTLIDW